MKKYFISVFALLFLFGCDNGGGSSAVRKRLEGADHTKNVAVPEMIGTLTGDISFPGEGAPKTGTCRLGDIPVCQGDRLHMCTPFESEVYDAERLIREILDIKKQISDLNKQTSIQVGKDSRLAELEKKGSELLKTYHDKSGTWIEYVCPVCSAKNETSFKSADYDSPLIFPHCELPNHSNGGGGSGNGGGGSGNGGGGNGGGGNGGGDDIVALDGVKPLPGHKGIGDLKMPGDGAPVSGKCFLTDLPRCKENRLFMCTPYEKDHLEIIKVGKEILDLMKELEKNPSDPAGLTKMIELFGKLGNFDAKWLNYSCERCAVQGNLANCNGEPVYGSEMPHGM